MDNRDKTTNVNVLGEIYSIQYSNEIEDPKLINMDGYCDVSSKKIVLVEIEDGVVIEEQDDVDVYRRKLLRHEIVHAFLEESGLACYSKDEVLVDWIALQAEKMFTQFVAVGALKFNGLPTPLFDKPLACKEGDTVVS